jgi:glutathione S-transferase
VNFYSKFNKGTISDEVNLQHLRDLEAGWGAQERRLADGRPFLTGTSFSKADIIWAIKVLRIFECGYPFKKNFPALFSWFSRIQQRPGFQEGVMQNHRTMGRIFRLKSSLENLLGMGIRKVSKAPAQAM